jgi:hypothetical protein
VLVTPKGHAKLCDFGASFFYSASSTAGFEKIEVQAYGLLVYDLSVRLAGYEEEVGKCKQILDRIVELCRHPNAAKRPSFSDIVQMLNKQFFF